MKRYKITEIPETMVHPMGGQYTVFRPVQVVHPFSRIGHYLIDAIALQGTILLLLNYFDLVATDPAALTDEQAVILQLKGSGVGLAVTFLYYFLFEGFLGTTPGKLLFKRVVIDEYGERPTIARIAVRSVSRLIPFEAISCFWARGWHDRISNTFVVTKDEADALWEKLTKLETQQESTGN